MAYQIKQLRFWQAKPGGRNAVENQLEWDLPCSYDVVATVWSNEIILCQSFLKVWYPSWNTYTVELLPIFIFLKIIFLFVGVYRSHFTCLSVQGQCTGLPNNGGSRGYARPWGWIPEKDPMGSPKFRKKQGGNEEWFCFFPWILWHVFCIMM